MHKLDLEKTEEPEIKIANICWIIEKQENSSNTSTSASLTMLKPLTVCITTNCENFFFKRWEYQTTLPAWEKPLCRSRSNSQNWTWNKGLDKNWEGVHQGYIQSPAYLTCMQNILCKIMGCMLHRLESRLPVEISIVQICR